MQRSKEGHSIRSPTRPSNSSGTVMPSKTIGQPVEFSDRQMVFRS